MTARTTLKLGVGGLGVIGTAVVDAMRKGIPGLELAAVSARDRAKAVAVLSQFDPQPAVVPLSELAHLADVVLECATAAAYDELAWPAVESGKIFVTLSSGALLERPELLELARQTGARIIVPSGGIVALDGLKAAAESEIHEVKLITRKPPKSLAGAKYLLERSIDVNALDRATKVFDGNAREAARAFPANANVAASISLAGIGPERTRVEIWADPGIDQNLQELRVRSKAAEFTIQLASHPMPENPRTGSLTLHSTIATLRALESPLTVGL
ncbi:MAG: aspartate dehydrogenase [Steroidobacteraceae bacterium]